MSKHLSKWRHSLRRAITSGAPSLADDVLTIQAAKALTEHYDPSHLLPYIDFDEGYVVRDDGDRPQLGFGFYLSPAIIGGTDMEDQLEMLISRAPDDTVIQFAMHSSPSVNFRLDLWRERRLRYCKIPILEELVNRRVAHFKDRSTGESLLPKDRIHPRELRCYLFCTMTYKQDPEHEGEIKNWKRVVDDFRNSARGTLEVMGLGPTDLGKQDAQAVLRELCNPQKTPADLRRTAPETTGHERFKNDCFERQTRLRVGGNGDLIFSDFNKSRTVVPVTVDQYPSPMKLWMTGQLLGKIDSSTDRIAPPFWLYTIIHKPNRDKAKDSMSARLGLLSKQCMSDSEMYKSMVPHIFTRRDETQKFLEDTRTKYSPVRVWSGINIITSADLASADADYVCGLWRKAGFKASREGYISLPIWQQSLPWGYNPSIDTSTQGIQRAQPMTSMNAACAAICQGDWSGNGPVMKTSTDGSQYPYANGLLLTSRRGQMACVDIFESETNYNFAIIATTGAGKSFLANEIVADMRCRNGLVRIIDAGGSYRDLVAMMGGLEIRFDPAKPMSLNPFWGMSNHNGGKIESRKDDDEAVSSSEISEMMPLLKDVACQMAFPIGEPTNFQYALDEKAIYEKYLEIGERLGMKEIYEWFLKKGEDDARAEDIALQLEPYAIGRLSVWFNGEPELDLSNPVTLLELEELNNDPDLRTVILTLLMAQTTRDMYLTDRSIPKLMLTDETWDLFSDPKPAKVIETAFRRIRKYFGAAGFVTQGFADTDMSDAAVAAYSNASWRFILKQTGESAAYAKKHKKLGDGNEHLYEMINNIRPGTGYSEVYVQHESGDGLFRFITDKYTYHLYSSKASDIVALERIQKERNCSMAEAISLIADGKAELNGLEVDPAA